jgi:DNA methylase
MTRLRKSNRGIISALDTVDWNFSRGGTWANDLHSLHWFPGNFIPQIPSYLVQLLSEEGTVVFDPFCGSCTTGVEAIILGRAARMSDFHPLSYLISKAKMTLLTDIVAREEFASFALPPLLSSSGVSGPSAKNAELIGWFHPDTLDQLVRLWTFICDCPQPRIRNTLEMLFSDTLFACASTLRSPTTSGKPRRHHWGWVADNVLPKPPIWHDAVRLFEERLYRARSITSHLTIHEASFDMRQEDVRSCSYDSDSADLVVTSPPYLGMIDYTAANRLTYLWYGWDMASDRALEIGARYRRNSPAAPEQYLVDIREAVLHVHRVLKRSGFCAMVIGSSRKYPDMALRVIDLFKEKMTLLWGPKERIPTRRRVSDRMGSAPSEYICVLRKE